MFMFMETGSDHDHHREYSPNVAYLHVVLRSLLLLPLQMTVELSLGQRLVMQTAFQVTESKKPRSIPLQRVELASG